MRGYGRLAKDAVKAFIQKIMLIDKQVARVLDVAAIRLSKRITSKFMGGSTTGQTRLRSRTGKLEKSVLVVKARNKAGGVTSSVRITSKYASVHFGRKGDVTIIRPKSKRALTIPTRFAQDGSGATLKSAENIKASRSGFIKNGVIFGSLTSSGQPKPLFILKSQVKVPVRIDIQDNILRPTTKKLESSLARVLRDF